MSNQTFKNSEENEEKIKTTPVTESPDLFDISLLADKNALRSTWLGMRDSNPRYRDQNPVPYHLANPHHC